MASSFPHQPLNNLHYTVLAFFLAVLTPCIPKDSFLLRRGILLLHIICVAQVFIAPPPSDVPNTAVLYTFGLLEGNLLGRYFDRVYVRVPEKAFHRINADGSKEDASKLPPVQRFLWASELFGLTRGIGWDWCVKTTRRSPPPTRSQYLQTQLLKYVAMYAGLYFTGLCGRSILNGFENVANPLLREIFVTATSNAVFLHAFIVLGWALTVYSHFGLMMLPPQLIGVGLRVGPRTWREMDGWPPTFGSLKSAYSIRRFWGYVRVNPSSPLPNLSSTLLPSR